MEQIRLEGATRPQSTAAPFCRPLLWAAAASWPLAYLYTRGILFHQGYAGWPLPAFALAFLAWVDLTARALHRPAAGETPLWAGCWLALSAAMPLWGYQQGGLGDWQVIVWHLFAIWFVLARCGMLAQGGTGGLVVLDALAGLFTLPWPHFADRLRVVWQALRAALARRSAKNRLAAGALTVLLTLAVFALAWSQLSAADRHLAEISHWLTGWFRFTDYELLNPLFWFLFSLPVGAWLFGLLSGCLRREQPPVTPAAFHAWLAPLRRLPRLTAHAVMGALCALYGLVFALQMVEWLSAGLSGLSAPHAAAFAVDGFWELFRILLLNFAVLAAVRLLAPRAPSRGLTLLFCAFGPAFALMAGAKLAVYAALYGLTPRRVLAGWFLCVLLVWSVLALVRQFRSIPAARIAVFTLAVSFTVLSCVNVDQRVIDFNLWQYEQGLVQRLDTEVLRACGWQG